MSNKQKIAVRVFLWIFGFIFVVQFFKLVGKGFDSLLDPFVYVWLAIKGTFSLFGEAIRVIVMPGLTLTFGLAVLSILLSKNIRRSFFNMFRWMAGVCMLVLGFGDSGAQRLHKALRIFQKIDKKTLKYFYDRKLPGNIARVYQKRVCNNPRISVEYKKVIHRRIADIIQAKLPQPELHKTQGYVDLNEELLDIADFSAVHTKNNLKEIISQQNVLYKAYIFSYGAEEYKLDGILVSPAGVFLLSFCALRNRARAVQSVVDISDFTTLPVNDIVFGLKRMRTMLQGVVAPQVVNALHIANCPYSAVSFSTHPAGRSQGTFTGCLTHELGQFLKGPPVLDAVQMQAVCTLLEERGHHRRTLE